MMIIGRVNPRLPATHQALSLSEKKIVRRLPTCLLADIDSDDDLGGGESRSLPSPSLFSFADAAGPMGNRLIEVSGEPKEEEESAFVQLMQQVASKRNDHEADWQVAARSKAFLGSPKKDELEQGKTEAEKKTLAPGPAAALNKEGVEA